MIPEPDTIEELAGLWLRIAGDARRGLKGPHIVHLQDGVRSIEARYEHGLMWAVFRTRNRDLEVAEEQELCRACGVPEDASRVPMGGQDRMPNYRRGIVDLSPRRQVAYWWKEAS